MGKQSTHDVSFQQEFSTLMAVDSSTAVLNTFNAYNGKEKKKILMKRIGRYSTCLVTRKYLKKFFHIIF